jgi:hypothetical protein
MQHYYLCINYFNKNNCRKFEPIIILDKSFIKKISIVIFYLQIICIHLMVHSVLFNHLLLGIHPCWELPLPSRLGQLKIRVLALESNFYPEN